MSAHALVRTPAIVGFVVVAVCVASMWPLATYAVSLSSFGLLHVATELRFVDQRLGRRISPSLARAVAILIGGTVLLRLLRMAGLLDGAFATPAELLLVAATCAATWPTLRVRGLIPTALGVVVAAAIALGAVVAPVPTMLTLSVLHNATPVGFLVESASPNARHRTALAGIALFLGVPLFVASGAITALFAHVGALFPDAAPWASVGVLREHLGVYVWPAWHDDERAIAWFSAAVVAQLLHYAAVIIVLPARIREDDVPMLLWPSRTMFVAVVGLLSIGLLVHFVVDFVQARLLYGLVAAVHAWLELPLLLLCLGAPWLTPGSQSASSPSPPPPSSASSSS